MITPLKPTPHEIKLLSNIDDQESLHLHVPINVIRKELAEILVFYYPLAGRLREGGGRKLMVYFLGEGVLFIKGITEITLKEFGDVLCPPFLF